MSRFEIAIIISVVGFGIPASAQPLRLPAKPTVPTPLVNGDAANYTQAQFEKDVLIPFYTRTLVDAYKKHGVRDAKWDQPAVEFLEKMVLYESEAPGAPLEADALAEAVRLEDDLKCRDPLIRYYRRRLEIVEWKWSWVERMRQIAVELAQGGYPPSRVAAAQMLLAAVEYGWGDRTRVLAAIDSGSAQWVAAFESADNSGETQRAVFELFAREKKLVDWFVYRSFDGTPERWFEFAKSLLEDDKIDRWTAHMVSGQCYVDQGWDDGGGRFEGRTVPRDAAVAQRFARLAAVEFKKALSVDPSRPEPAARLIECTYLSRDELDGVERWLRAVQKAQVDYMPAYEAYAFLLARIDRNALLEFFRGCINTDRPNTDLPLIGLPRPRGPKGFWWGYHFVVADERLRDLAISGIADTRLKDRWRPAARVLLSSEIALAYRAKNYKHAGDLVILMHEMKITPSERHFDAIGLPSGHIAKYAAGRGGEVSVLVRGADEAFDAGEIDKAERLYKDALAVVPDGHPSRAYSLTQIEAIGWMRQFQSGEVVSLDVDQEMTGWHKRGGEWIRRADGALQGRSRDAWETPVILANAHFGPRFELLADVEVTVDDMAQAEDVAVIIAHGGHAGGINNMRAVRLHVSKQEVSFPHTAIYVIMKREKQPILMKNQIRIARFDMEWAVWLNGKLIFHDMVNTRRHFSPNEQIGFAAVIGQSRADFTSAISNIRIRKLEKKPEEMN